MRVLSLHQPHASACFHFVNGRVVKGVETRHWETDYRGPLAIHAARKWDADQREFAAVEHALGRLPKRLPFGAIIGVVNMTDCRPTDVLRGSISAIERIWGNYGPGRFGFIFERPHALPEPIPCVGRQKWFSIPDEMIPEHIRRAVA
jgi:hypothetical protein